MGEHGCGRFWGNHDVLHGGDDDDDDDDDDGDDDEDDGNLLLKPICEAPRRCPV